MVALVVFGALALVLALTSWVPHLVGADSGVASVEPGRLLVDRDTKGIVTLGAGYTVSLYASGFRYAKDDETMAETVTRGSPVVALVGSVGGTAPSRERVTSTLARVHIRTLEITPGQAHWTGEVASSDLSRTLALDWQVRLEGERIVTTVTVVGADGMVLPLDWRPAVTGIAPTLPARNLRRAQWWLAGPSEDRAFTWVLGTTVGVGPATVPRAVDLAVDGRVDVHVWASTVTIVLSGQPAPRATLAS